MRHFSPEGKPSSGPSQLEVAILWMFSAMLFIAVVSHFRSYKAEIDVFGDNGAYLGAAQAIHAWNFDHVSVKQFWGLSYVIAALSFIPGFPPHVVLLVICGSCSLIAVLLAYRLWGGWVAGYFAVLNFDWLQRSFLGGAEPLFIGLLFASFLCIRKQRWIFGAFFAALSTVVRPLGIFALLAIGIVLLLRKQYRTFASCTAVAAVIGFSYLVPFWLYFHDPLYQVHRYQASDWHSRSAIGWPFKAIVVSFINNREPVTNVVLTLGWILFVIAGVLAMTRRSFRESLRNHQAEYIFVFFYFAFFMLYNSAWDRAEFPRFAIPLLPFVLIALEPITPKSRVVLYFGCVVGSILAACSAIGIRNVFPILH